MHLNLLVEEDSGADNELEDVLEGLQGLQQLVGQLLSVLHVILQNFGQLPTHTVTWNTITKHHVLYLLSSIFSLFVLRVIDSRVCQRSTEMLSNVGLKDGVKVLELSVRYEPNYEHLSENIFIKM